MKDSKYTKKCKTKRFILGLVHFLLLFGPLLVFFPYGFAIGTAVTKITMVPTLLIAAVLTIMSWFKDAVERNRFHKTVMWVLILGATIALNSIKPFIYIMAGTSIVDELIINPLREKNIRQLEANRVCDYRI